MMRIFYLLKRQGFSLIDIKGMNMKQAILFLREHNTFLSEIAEKKAIVVKQKGKEAFPVYDLTGLING